MPGRTSSTPKLAADARKGPLELQRVFALQALKVASSFINSSTLARRVRDLQDGACRAGVLPPGKHERPSIMCIPFHALLHHVHSWGQSKG